MEMKGVTAMDTSRVAPITAHMKAAGLEQLIVTSTTSLFYLTGLWVEPHERMIALLLKADGSAHLFGNEIFGLTSTPGLPLTTHKDGADPVADLAQALSPGKLGVDKFWYAKFLIPLMARRPDVAVVEGSFPIDLCRMTKDETERAAMRHSSAMNDQVIHAAISAIREGVRENELAALVNREFLARGADCEGTQLVCFGPNGADPHHSGDSTVLKPGDSVIFDIFTPISRYWCDMTRTVFFRTADKELRKVYETVRAANLAAEAMIRPGVPMRDIDAAARRVIGEAGYGNYFHHRLGHGCGLECHEPPDNSASCDLPAQPGMVFSVEPGIYLPSVLGVRIEDLVLVTEDGCEVLNAASKDLRIVG